MALPLLVGWPLIRRSPREYGLVSDLDRVHVSHASFYRVLPEERRLLRKHLRLRDSITHA